MRVRQPGRAERLVAGIYVEGWGDIHLEETTRHAEWTDDGRPRDRRQLKNRERGRADRAEPPELTTLLHAHMAEFGTGPDGRLFVVGEHAEELPKLTYMRAWRTARAATCTPEVATGPLGATPYSLRHACVSTFIPPRDRVVLSGRSLGREESNSRLRAFGRERRA